MWTSVETTNRGKTTSQGVISSEGSVMMSDSLSTTVQRKIFSTESTQEIKTTMQPQTEVTKQSHISATSREINELTMSSFKTSTEYISETLAVENLTSSVTLISFENITATGDQYDSIKKNVSTISCINYYCNNDLHTFVNASSCNNTGKMEEI